MPDTQVTSANLAAAGSKTYDHTVMTLESDPFVTMLILGIAGLSAFPWPTLVGAILPLLAGMVIANLDKEMREFLSRAIPVMIPFFAFVLGSGLDLAKVWQAGLLGLALDVVVVVVTGTALLLADRLISGCGVTAANAAAVPAIVAAANSVYAPAAAHAIIPVAAAVNVITVLVPLLTAWVASPVGPLPDAADKVRSPIGVIQP